MKQRGAIFIILVLLSLLPGCWDARDLEGLAFPLAAAYDLHHPGSADPTDPEETSPNNRIDVTTLIPNLSPETKSPVHIETLSGITAADTRRKRGLTDANTYVIGMIRTLIVGEDLARQGLNPYMDSLWRDPKITGTIYMAVAAGRGDDILKTPVKNDTHVGTYLTSLFDSIEQRTFVPVTDLAQFFSHLVTGKNPVLPILERRDDMIIISGTAIFRKDRMIRKLGTGDTLSLVLLRGIEERSYLPFYISKNGTIERGTLLVNNSRKFKWKKMPGDIPL